MLYIVRQGSGEDYYQMQNKEKTLFISPRFQSLLSFLPSYLLAPHRPSYC